MKRFYLGVLLTTFLAAACGAFTDEDGWRVAVQAWTFRSSTFSDTLGKTAELGVRYIEAYPGQALGGGLDGTFHHGMNEALREQVKTKLKDTGVTLVQYGVVGGKDEAEWRQIFSFAKAMGIETITSEPPPEQMDLVGNLCDEYGVNLAIHNHPKPSRYWNPNTVLAAVKDRSKRVGVCADTGHYVRSGLDPVAVLNKIGRRAITLHLKDLAERNPKTHDVVYGTGKSDMNGQLLAMKKRGFKGVISIEYEHETPDLMKDVAGCVTYLRAWDGSSAPAHQAMTEDVRAVWAAPPGGQGAQWTIRDLLPATPPKPEVALDSLTPVAIQNEPDGTPTNRQGTVTLNSKPVEADTVLCYRVPEDKQGFVSSASVESGTAVFKVYGVQKDDGSEGDLLAQSPKLPAASVSRWHFDVHLQDRYPMVRLDVESVDGGTEAARAAWINSGFVAK